MFEDLEKGQSLRDLILEILRQGPASISQLSKTLKSAHSIDLHRLALAGYLRAMADVGILEEREIPPAKVYQIRPMQAPPTLYDAVARRVRDMGLPEPEAAQLFVQALYDLFHRPVFREELRRTGFDAVAGLKEAAAEERQNARRLFSKASLKLPFNDPAYLPSPDEASMRPVREAARHIVAAVLRQSFHAEHLAQTTRQSTLGGTP